VDQKQVGFALGAADYLIKPIRKPVLLETIRRHAPAAANDDDAAILLVDDDPELLICWRSASGQPDTKLRVCKAEQEPWRCSLQKWSVQSCSIC
jgi:hypothetical protein